MTNNSQTVEKVTKEISIIQQKSNVRLYVEWCNSEWIQVHFWWYEILLKKLREKTTQQKNKTEQNRIEWNTMSWENFKSESMAEAMDIASFFFVVVKLWGDTHWHKHTLREKFVIILSKKLKREIKTVRERKRARAKLHKHTKLPQKSDKIEED